MAVHANRLYLRIEKEENPLQSFLYWTNQKKLHEETGTCADPIINTKPFDSYRFDSDPDSLERRELVKDIDNDLLELYYQVFLLTHLRHPDNHRKVGILSIYDTAQVNYDKINSCLPRFRRGQWDGWNMKRIQGMPKVDKWLTFYGAQFCRETLHLLDKGLSCKELIAESKKIMGWSDAYHLTKTFKDMALLGKANINLHGDVHTSVNTNRALRQLFDKPTTILELMDHTDIHDLHEFPFNLEHNLCGWTKWLMEKQEVWNKPVPSRRKKQ